MRKSSLFWGSILVIIGVIFLLDNLDLIQVEAWKIIGPVFLLSLGIWILWGALSKSSTQTEHLEIPVGGARKASIKIQHGAGKLDVSSLSNPSLLVEGDFRGGVEHEVASNGDDQKVMLRMSSKNIPFNWVPGDSLNWSIRILNQIPVSLQFETGAAEVHLDLSDLLVQELKFSSGASSSVILMPRAAGFTKAKIEAGAASVQIHIPDGVGAKIRTQGGLSSITVDDQKFVKKENEYFSSGWESAENKIELSVEVGVGSINIQ